MGLVASRRKRSISRNDIQHLAHCHIKSLCNPSKNRIVTRGARSMMRLDSEVIQVPESARLLPRANIIRAPSGVGPRPESFKSSKRL